jgi:hypothetical protein
VVVVSSANRDAIEGHVRAAWPEDVAVEWVAQDTDERSIEAAEAGRAKPLGTAHAVLAAAGVLNGAFAVANADDVYGRSAFGALANHLRCSGRHALVTYSLRNTIVGGQRVNRALCRVDEGRLEAVEEGSIAPQTDGTYVWEAIGGGRTERLSGDEPVSTNLWGFDAAILDDLEAVVDAFMNSGRAASNDECLLPDVVRSLLTRGAVVTALYSPEPCLGVTHPEDLSRVRAALNAHLPPWP